MLTIQPALSKTAFGTKQKRNLTPSQIDAMLARPNLKAAQIDMLEEQDLTPEQIELLEERKYQLQRSEVREQRDNFDKLAKSDEIPMPDVAKKILKGGTLVTTGILSGMAAGWGTGKTIKGLEKIAKTDFVKGLKAQMKAFKVFVKDNSKILKTNFLNSEAYKLHKERLAKAHGSKFWGPVLKFFGKIGNGIKLAFVKTKNGIKHVINKIKGVKPETLKKGTVNTVGTASGLAATVETYKNSNNDNNKIKSYYGREDD